MLYFAIKWNSHPLNQTKAIFLMFEYCVKHQKQRQLTHGNKKRINSHAGPLWQALKWLKWLKDYVEIISYILGPSSIFFDLLFWINDLISISRRDNSNEGLKGLTFVAQINIKLLLTSSSHWERLGVPFIPIVIKIWSLIPCWPFNFNVKSLKSKYVRHQFKRQIPEIWNLCNFPMQIMLIARTKEQ